mgnify:CR=1 FL=1
MWSIFKDNNEWNEKNVVGFIAFLVMVLFALLDLLTGYLGKDLVINETIYDSFTWVVLVSLALKNSQKNNYIIPITRKNSFYFYIYFI